MEVCGGTACSPSVGYSFFIAGAAVEDVPAASLLAINYTFGCQTKETGLFRTQLANGIIGLSGVDGTLPMQLVSSGLTQEQTFGICMRSDGGRLSVGGIDPSLFFSKEPRSDLKNVYWFHSNDEPALDAIQPSALPDRRWGGPNKMVWAKLVKETGWFTVRVLSIFMSPNGKHSGKGDQSDNDSLIDIGANVNELNMGKGAIIDSGTTDTYIPAAVAARFRSAFHRLSGFEFFNKMDLTAEKKKKLPNIIFRLRGFSVAESGHKHRQGFSSRGNNSDEHSAANYTGASPIIDIVMRPEDYAVEGSGSRHELNIFLSEDAGMVLGANFMNNKYVVFDRDRRRVGFGSSDCGAAEDSSIAGKAGRSAAAASSSKSKAIRTNDRVAQRRRLLESAPNQLTPSVVAHSTRKSAANQNGSAGADISRRCRDLISQSSRKASSSHSSSGLTVRPIAPCSAKCHAGTGNNSTSSVFSAFGSQQWKCLATWSDHSDNGKIRPQYMFSRLCVVSCGEAVPPDEGVSYRVDGAAAIRGGSDSCLAGPWTWCDRRNCRQSRQVWCGRQSPSSAPVRRQERSCASAECPLGANDRVLMLAIRLIGIKSFSKDSVATRLDELAEAVAYSLKVSHLDNSFIVLI